MPKSIAVCCDGTSNSVYGDVTNVLRLYRSLERSEQQLAFYDAGVGTLSDPTRKTRFGRWLSRNVDMGVGLSVRENACAAYAFLARNYEPGDRLFLFGFSRGGYTVRALAGMIHAVGLVRPELEHLAPDAWAVFANDEVSLVGPSYFEAAARFKKTFGVRPAARIHFLGAWDTVSSFGWISNLRTTPYTADNSSIDHVRHAIAIDERRAMFAANRFYPKNAEHQSFKEVWFAGTHGDVGGGWPEEKSGLAKITLEWMFREAEEQGLHMDTEEKKSFLGRSADRPDRVPPDAECPVNRSLRRGWWLLETIPRRQWRHAEDGGAMGWCAPHIGRRRRIPTGATIHDSVFKKMEVDPAYRPKNLPSQHVVET